MIRRREEGKEVQFLPSPMIQYGGSLSDQPIVQHCLTWEENVRMGDMHVQREKLAVLINA